jgi:hypothetical protein
MRRALALFFLFWGVAFLLFGLFEYFAGLQPGTLQRLLRDGVAGAILLTIAWWLDRSARRPPPPGGPSSAPRPTDAA